MQHETRNLRCGDCLKVIVVTVPSETRRCPYCESGTMRPVEVLTPAILRDAETAR